MTARPDRARPSAERMKGDLSLAVPPELVEAIAVRVVELITDRLPAGKPSSYLTVDQAADYLACPRSRIYDLVSLGRVRPRRDGRRLLFRPEDLDAALDVEEP